MIVIFFMFRDVGAGAFNGDVGSGAGDGIGVGALHRGVEDGRGGEMCGVEALL